MIDLTKHVLPDAIIVDGRAFRIKTDFTHWINFSQKIDERAPLLDFDYIYIEEKPEDRAAGFNELMTFFINKRELPHVRESGSHEKFLDYTLDADLIFAAFWQQYQIDLVEIKHLHWWKFQALLFGLKDTKLADVMSFRGYDENDKTSYKDYMKRQREAWKIDTPDPEAQRILEQFNSL